MFSTIAFPKKVLHLLSDFPHPLYRTHLLYKSYHVFVFKYV